MDGFSSDLWSKLTNAERIEHCHAAAKEADTFAKSASPDLRTVYKQLADQWRVLAAEIERESKLF